MTQESIKLSFSVFFLQQSNLKLHQLIIHQLRSHSFVRNFPSQRKAFTFSFSASNFNHRLVLDSKCLFFKERRVRGDKVRERESKKLIGRKRTSHSTSIEKTYRHAFAQRKCQMFERRKTTKRNISFRSPFHSILSSVSQVAAAAEAIQQV